MKCFRIVIESVRSMVVKCENVVLWENNKNIENHTIVCTKFFIDGTPTKTGSVSKYNVIYLRERCGIIIEISYIGSMTFSVIQ